MDLNLFFEELDSMFKTKDIKEVEQFVSDALKQAQQTSDWAAAIAISNELGGIYRVTNRTEDGKIIYQAALEALKLIDLENTLQHGTTLLNLASVYSESKEYSAALTLYLQTAEIFQQQGFGKDIRMAALFNNISHVYDQLNQDDKAIENAEKALYIIQSLPNAETELATTHTTLANRYIKQQRYPKAEEHLLTAERIFLQSGGKVDVHYAATLSAMGGLYYTQKDYPKAIERFQQALDLIQQTYGKNEAWETVHSNLQQVQRERQSTLNQVTEKSNPTVHTTSQLSGLALSEAYYETVGKPMLSERFFMYQPYMAVGLVGEGSECLGFDDAFSQDHDFGPGFCIWLPDEIHQRIGTQMQQAYDALPKTFQNIRRIETAEGGGRVGVFGISAFYQRYIGKMPKSNLDWLMIPETNLCTATSGKVFSDPSGEFTAIRNTLLQFYPRDVFLKKLVARLATMAQSGQYNYSRCIKRGDTGSAYLACSEFVKAAISAVYLLNQTYMPFYKWMFKGMEQLSVLADTKPMLERLISLPDNAETAMQKVELIETVCILVRKELNRQGISQSTDDFMNTHCAPIMASISDEQIKNLPILYDPKQ